MADSTGTTTYAYDPYGRLQSVVHRGGGQGHLRLRPGQQYDLSRPIRTPAPSRARTPPPGTGIVAYGYDNANRMNSLHRLERQDHQLRVRQRLQLERHDLSDHGAPPRSPTHTAMLTI